MDIMSTKVIILSSLYITLAFATYDDVFKHINADQRL